MPGSCSDAPEDTLGTPEDGCRKLLGMRRQTSSTWLCRWREELPPEHGQKAAQCVPHRTSTGASCLGPRCRSCRGERHQRGDQRDSASGSAARALPSPAHGENLVDRPIFGKTTGKTRWQPSGKACRAPHWLAGYQHGAHL
ncbi:uncharacterized protein LOC106631377 [Falco cherrug]|uniref:uncharacterized protein LOC106631377 n=1 Tax=Falco cherrug TaxID=345164 RepID=UPI00247A7ED6|nr:uncharacterized protein LOC106631377 [Falco cherrug]